MWVETYNALERRMQALRGGERRAVTMAERVRSALGRARPVDLSPIIELGRELAAAGIYTSADVRLLKELGAHQPGLQALADGLMQRARSALDLMARALTDAELDLALDRLSAQRRDEVLHAFDALGRVVKTAAIFSAPRNSAGPLTKLGPGVARPDGRPVSVKLALVEFLADRAVATVDDVGSRKRDLGLAHELLLQIGTESGADRQRAHQARLEISRLRAEVRPRAAVRSLDELVRHVRELSRETPQRAWSELHSLYQRAVEADDLALATTVRQVLQQVSPGPALMAKGLEVDRWAEALPETALPPGGQVGVHDLTADALASLALGSDADAAQLAQMAAGCSRLFDIEESLAHETVEVVQRSQKPTFRRVSYPTQLMTYETTNQLEDVSNLVITHPSTILLDLASHRQVVRAYLERVEPPSAQKRQQTAVRVYVLDASGSMFGKRSQFRDAILVGELNAIRLRARLKIAFDPLYFSFFNDVPSELTRVDSAEAATRHIEKLLSHSPADGQTDITLALISAFDSIRAARGRDPYLARATVVLVTDGEDGVDLELVRRLRKPLSGVDISLSFVSLGDENADLKRLALEQRSQGGRAFYHHLNDAEIELAPSDFDSRRKTLLPAHVEVTPELADRLAPALEALEAIARRRPPPVTSSGVEQFDVFFPPLVKPTAAGPVATQLVDMLDAVADAASLAPVETRAREAVTMLTHLLSLYEISVPQYLEQLTVDDAALHRARERVRLLCKPWS